MSAKRTAASAALAAQTLHPESPAVIGILGCGVVNFETVRFLLHLWPGVEEILVCDVIGARAERFAARCNAAFPAIRARVVGDWHAVAARAPIASIATTAMHPHLSDLGPGALRTVLHLSLRDLLPDVVVANDNVVDDADHVCRAETSVHLAEQRVGHRRFIRADVPSLLLGTASAPDHDRPVIFSPFGLGILDLALADLVCERAAARGRGTRIAFGTTKTS